jgi:hypothetical protein
MLVSSLTPKSDQILKKVVESPGLESASIKVEALEDQESESDDKGSEKTLQDEFEESKEINFAENADIESENALQMVAADINSNGKKDLSKCFEEEHKVENQSRQILTAVDLPKRIAPESINLKSKIPLSAQNYDDLVSDFVNDIIDIVVKSYEPDDSQVLSYVNDVLNEVVKELEMSHQTSQKENFNSNLDQAIIHAPVPILKAAPAAESLEQWHIPSKSGSPEIEEEPMSVEPWYVPSWSEKSCETVTMNNLPDILTTLRSSVTLIAKL